MVTRRHYLPIFVYMANSKTARGRIKRIWQGMKDRCSNCNHSAYKYYGGRGIKICEEWLNSFDAFYAWSMSNGYRDGLTIDRFPDNDGHYEASNCRWATMKQQSNNRRLKPGSKLSIPINLRGLALNTGVKYPTLCSRIQRGMTLEEAVGYVDNRVNDVRTSKPIIQYDMQGNKLTEYPSIAEIIRTTSYKKANIINHLRQNGHTRSHAYGFIWKYKT